MLSGLVDHCDVSDERNDRMESEPSPPKERNLTTKYCDDSMDVDEAFSISYVEDDVERIRIVPIPENIS